MVVIVNSQMVVIVNSALSSAPKLCLMVKISPPVVNFAFSIFVIIRLMAKVAMFMAMVAMMAMMVMMGMLMAMVAMTLRMFTMMPAMITMMLVMFTTMVAMMLIKNLELMLTESSSSSLVAP